MLRHVRSKLQIPCFETEEDNQIARILFKILYALPLFYLILITARAVAGDMDEVWILFVGFLLLVSAFGLLYRKKLRPAVFITSLLILAQVTATATAGQGIRDLAIINYPIIIILMTLLMDVRSFLIMTGLTILSLAWITIGAWQKWYAVNPPPPPGLQDFIISVTLITLTALIAHKLAANIRSNLQKARTEIAARERMSRVIETNLREKELLLKEIHHRVKNNLTVINSLLSLQKKHIQDKRDAETAFDNMRTRIISMALVHEQLYKSEDFTSITMNRYIEDMAGKLRFIYTPQRPVAIDIEVDDIRLTIDNAIPCGMIINETVTNALKHAFHEAETPRIVIGLKEANGRYILSVRDNGPGLAPDKAGPGRHTLGLRLIDLLVEQLDGEKEVISDQGTAFVISFPAV